MTKGYVYAVRMLVPDFPYNPIKIGFGIDPVKRVRNYVGAGPFPIEWIGAWPAENGVESEAEIHRTFAGFRLQGEWFFPHADLLALINQKLAKHSEHQQQLSDRMNRRKIHQFNAHPLRKPKADELVSDFLKQWEAAKVHVIRCPSCNPDPELAVPLMVTDLNEIRARVNAYIQSKRIVVMVASEMAELLGVPVEQVKFWQKKRMIRYAPVSGGRFHVRSLADALDLMAGKAA